MNGQLIDVLCPRDIGGISGATIEDNSTAIIYVRIQNIATLLSKSRFAG